MTIHDSKCGTKFLNVSLEVVRIDFFSKQHQNGSHAACSAYRIIDNQCQDTYSTIFPQDYTLDRS
eukprot:722601-Amphidinium_carterae.1